MSSSFAANAHLSASSPICSLVHRLYAQSPMLRLLFLAQSIGSALALVVLAFGMLQICTRQQPVQLPIGTLLMMLNLCVALMLSNVGALLSSLYHLHVPLLRPPSSHCYWLSFTLSDCLMIRTILNVALFATYMAGACLALERMASSLLLIHKRDTRRALAIFLAVIQWLLSIFAAIPPSGLSPSSASSSALSPHCSAMTPSPTQFRPLFFAILSMQAFVLAIYSILIYHNHLDPQITRELARQNPLVLEQVHATEQSLPAAATVVGLFLASTFLDRNFLLAIASAFQSQLSPEQASGIWHGRAATDEIFKRAFWSEFQVLAIPLMSLLMVVIHQFQLRSQQRIVDEDIYERVSGSTAAAANVVSVRKVPSAIGGQVIAENAAIGNGEASSSTDRMSNANVDNPYEKTGGDSSPSTSTSSEGRASGRSSSGSSDGGSANGKGIGGKGKGNKKTVKAEESGERLEVK